MDVMSPVRLYGQRHIHALITSISPMPVLGLLRYLNEKSFCCFISLDHGLLRDNEGISYLTATCLGPLHHQLQSSCKREDFRLPVLGGAVGVVVGEVVFLEVRS